MWEELAAKLSHHGIPFVHVPFYADEPTIRNRISGDERFRGRFAAGKIDSDSETFRLDHVAAYVEACDWMATSADLVVDAVGSTPDEVATHMVEALESLGH